MGFLKRWGIAVKNMSYDQEIIKWHGKEIDYFDVNDNPMSSPGNNEPVKS